MLSRKKFEIGNEITFAGQVISSRGIKPDPERMLRRNVSLQLQSSQVRPRQLPWFLGKDLKSRKTSLTVT